MIFPIYLVFIFVGALLLWYAFYVVARHAALVDGQAPDLQERHSVTEKVLDNAELAFESGVVGANRWFRILAVSILSTVIPVFRSLTKNIERGLVGMLGSLRGQHNIKSMDRANGSPFVRDIKSHAAESKKGGGAIHEDGNVVN